MTLEMYFDYDGKPINQAQWGAMFKSDDRILGQTNLNGHRVSTVWLGIDHGYDLFGLKPLIFETMVFCRLDSPQHGPTLCDWDNWCDRYATKEQALRGHAIACNNMTGERHDEQEGL